MFPIIGTTNDSIKQKIKNNISDFQPKKSSFSSPIGN